MPQILMNNAGLAAAMVRSGLGDAPVGHLMRINASDRWVRFHFFTSKRYPETSEDDALIFAKFQSLSDRLFSVGEVVNMCAWTILVHDDDTETYHIKTRPAAWTAPAWRERLLDTAHFETNSFTIVSANGCDALSCYDGGFDIFTQKTSTRDGLRTDFADWLSARSDGL